MGRGGWNADLFRATLMYLLADNTLLFAARKKGICVCVCLKSDKSGTVTYVMHTLM